LTKTKHTYDQKQHKGGPKQIKLLTYTKNCCKWH